MFIHVPKHSALSDLTTTNSNGNRLYVTPDGRRYPSVTTVLKLHSEGAIQSWRKRVGPDEANKVSKRASGRGTRIHTLLEQTLRNEIVTPGLMDIELYRSVLPIIGRINNIRAMEQALYSHHLRMAGRCDCIADFDGKLSIIDYKTSAKPKKEEWIHAYFMQAAGYAVMYEERTGVPINRTVVIIAVDNDVPQVYIKTRNAWIKQLISYRDAWEKRYL